MHLPEQESLPLRGLRMGLTEVTSDQKISEKAIQLILDFEGIDNPWEWPGESSGITIGHGYDLGYETHFEQDWGQWLSDETMIVLRPAVGKTGQAARALAPRMRDAVVSKSAADAVFKEVTIPRETERTLKAFPGSDLLNPDALGALVSLVFNRGTSISGDRRSEMFEIHELLASGAAMRSKLNQMADLFEKMCRLWPNTRGLRRRRIAEAQLIRESIMQQLSL